MSFRRPLIFTGYIAQATVSEHCLRNRVLNPALEEQKQAYIINWNKTGYTGSNWNRQIDTLKRRLRSQFCTCCCRSPC